MQTTWKRGIAFFLLTVLLCGCFAPAGFSETAYTKFSRRDASYFDTETTFIAFARTEEEFEQVYSGFTKRLEELDHIFDAYNAYDGLHNLYYVNRHAAEAPVNLPQDLFNLLSWCKDQWEKGLRSTNIAMGAVLSIWHAYREAGTADPEHAQLPPMDALWAANEHVNFDDVILDAENRTVFFADPELTLDVGAVAKGYATDVLVSYLNGQLPSYLFSLGGNVYAGNPPLDGRAAWAVGIQDPLMDALQLALGGSQILDIVDVSNLTVITSGDYWRYYVVDGEKYHHIIDPNTLMPSRQVLSVTIVCDSGTLADFLSTALFVLSYEDGLALIEGMDGVEAMWVLPDGTVQATPGMAQYARSMK